MLSGCYDAVSSDLSPLKKKKLSSLLINRDTPILRTVLGQGQADSSQPVSLVCHPDSHDVHGSESEQHRMDKVRLFLSWTDGICIAAMLKFEFLYERYREIRLRDKKNMLKKKRTGLLYNLLESYVILHY